MGFQGQTFSNLLETFFFSLLDGYDDGGGSGDGEGEGDGDD